MKVTLIYTDNPEIEDLVGVKGQLVPFEEGSSCYEFEDVTFICQEKTVVNGNIRIVSNLGFVYLFEKVSKRTA